VAIVRSENGRHAAVPERSGRGPQWWALKKLADLDGNALVALIKEPATRAAAHIELAPENSPTW
jgi:hypothetical protein